MKQDIETMRHSAAHLLAAAVKKLFPKTSLGIGPVIENGFYYDFDSTHKFSTDDFQKIEMEIEALKKRALTFERTEEQIPSALKITKKIQEPYKEEIIRDLENRKQKNVSFYRTGDFVDLCTGPHVKDSGQVGEVKLLSVAGAYWKGTEKNKMLQRIYGTAWFTKKELEDYLQKIEEAKKRDHKRLGNDLGLFTFLPESPGMPYWYPKGFLLLDTLKNYMRSINKKYGYQEISTPQLAKSTVWETSGHWKLFREDMFTFKLDGGDYALKPMNCPQTILLFKSTQRSYRELPLKLSDLDVLHRYEDSGTLNGLFRVRELNQDDAHIFCTEDQVSSMIAELIEIAHKVYKTFDFSPSFYLSTRPAKALGVLSDWEKAKKFLEKSLNNAKVDFDIKEGEGSFYGPKIDLHIKDSLGRDWQLATIQLDTQMPKRFQATYIDPQGKEQTPLLIHRAILGSFERFLGIIIENYAGSFPVWLSPIQVIVIPIADRHHEYAKKVQGTLALKNIRVDIDERAETMQAKIRNAQIQKIPYMLVVGDREQVQKKVAVRAREEGDLGTMTTDEFYGTVIKKVVLVND